MMVCVNISYIRGWAFLIRLGLLTSLFIITDTVTSRQIHDSAHRSGGKNGAIFMGPDNSLPKFDNSTATNVTVELGRDVFLQCIVRNLGDKTVSWVQKKDLHILTIGRVTYTPDPRFEVIHIAHINNWTLHIKYVKKKDAGVYECQVSTSPKMSLLVTLNVCDVERSVTPKSSFRATKSHKAARAIVTGNFYVKSGSVINLTCTILDASNSPSYVYWYHNDSLINYETPQGVSLVTDKGDPTVSRLQIRNAQANHSGNYTCKASNADPTNVTVHVLNGETPAAMTGGKSLHSPNHGLLYLWLLSSWIITRIMR